VVIPCALTAHQTQDSIIHNNCMNCTGTFQNTMPVIMIKVLLNVSHASSKISKSFHIFFLSSAVDAGYFYKTFGSIVL
jgi:hypothetical protein